jgi:hypothetical protein
MGEEGEQTIRETVGLADPKPASSFWYSFLSSVVGHYLL